MHEVDGIAGRRLDGSHQAVAPGDSLAAVKVCNAVTTSCSGIALLQGMDFALDPNGGGDTSHAVDCINMSLRSSYCRIDDDLTLGATSAVPLGVVVVGSPSIPGACAHTQTMDWAPRGTGISADALSFLYGGAALLVQAFPNRRPEQIGAMPMSDAETTIYFKPALHPGQLAPITRTAAGEMCVDRALALSSLACSRESKSASLSFGTVDASGPGVIEKKPRIENLARDSRSDSVTPSFRHADDQASEAARVVAKPFAHVSGQGHEEITVKLVIDSTKRPEWTLNGGSQGGNGATLNDPEYDGYLTLSAGGEKVTVPWHVLPRKAVETSAALSGHGNPGPSLKLRNRGVEVSAYEVFSLTGQSTKIPKSGIPGQGSNQAVIDLRSVGVRQLPDVRGPGADVLEFAIHTDGRRAHPNYPAEVDIEIDANAAGTLQARCSASVGVTTATLSDTLSSERGLLLMYRRNAGKKADTIRIR